MLLMLQWPLNPGKLWPQNEEAVTVLLLKAMVLEPRSKPMACDRNRVNILCTYGLGSVFLKHEHDKEVCAENKLTSCKAASKQAVETI